MREGGQAPRRSSNRFLKGDSTRIDGRSREAMQRVQVPENHSLQVRERGRRAAESAKRKRKGFGGEKVVLRFRMPNLSYVHLLLAQLKHS